MKDDVSIIPVADRERWIAEHREGGLPSQSWAYARALSASGIDPKLAVVRAAGARMLLPFFERTWLGTTDIATIFGASGAIIYPSSGPPLSLWREFARGQGWVAGYIQLSPTLEVDRIAVDDELIASNAVFLLDLRKADLLRAVSDSIRQKIRNAARNAVLIDDKPLLVEALKRLYPPTMQRLGARPHYHFSAETLAAWALDPEALALGGRIDGSVEAVSLFLVSGNHAEYHLNASTEQGRDLTAWLIGNAVALLRERGVTTLNLGGGVRPGDGLYRFKSRFRGAPRPLHGVRQIYDSCKYYELCSRAGMSRGANWFPAYRAAEILIKN